MCLLVDKCDIFVCSTDLLHAGYKNVEVWKAINLIKELYQINTITCENDQYICDTLMFVNVNANVEFSRFY